MDGMCSNRGDFNYLQYLVRERELRVQLGDKNVHGRVRTEWILRNRCEVKGKLSLSKIDVLFYGNVKYITK
jgi:hypothetical protein